ncbi:hypothetical protein K1T71_004059 [Dendrolimus kikuchii]|uniref:Uncharacterized protein n=1 Tax=Dendrolimus kikuchii TaxID=765133 RepID=A0ACC1D9W9_9NEOP|nr:hypothetical protein K1T71_004059 [Dendrolimus kikuchii]
MNRSVYFADLTVYVKVLWLLSGPSRLWPLAPAASWHPAPGGRRAHISHRRARRRSNNEVRLQFFNEFIAVSARFMLPLTASLGARIDATPRPHEPACTATHHRADTARRISVIPSLSILKWPLEGRPRT